MCIYNKEEINIEEGIGYICIKQLDDGKLQSIFGNDTYFKSMWYKSKDRSHDPGNQRCDITYTPGFHIFTTLHDAEEYRSKSAHLSMKIFEVKYKHAYLKGNTMDANTIVAKERMIVRCIK